MRAPHDLNFQAIHAAAAAVRELRAAADDHAAAANSRLDAIEAAVADLQASQDEARMAVTSDDTDTTGPLAGVSRIAYPVGRFALQVSPVGGAATSWEVVVETSLDGVAWAEALTHTEAAPGADETAYEPTTAFPALFFRANVKALVLDTATALRVTVLALPLV